MESKIIHSPPLFYYLRVSKLSHAEFCVKRSKIETFSSKSDSFIPLKKEDPVTIGNRMHSIYSYLSYKDFDRMRLRLKLHLLADRGKFKKQIPDTNIMVVGVYDDLRILRDLATNKKYTVLVEVKTTSKKFMWAREVRAAIRQLQLYMWLLKENLEYLGYPLWKRSYLQIYSQKTKRLLKLIRVEYDDNIEEWVKSIVDMFKGLRPVSVPPYNYCKLCPVAVKSKCSWYEMRKDVYKKQEYKA